MKSKILTAWPTYILAFLTLLCFGVLILKTSFTQAQGNIIQQTQVAMPAIVEVHTQGTALFKGPESTAIDKRTGRIIQARGIKAAQISNNGSGVIIDPAGIIVTNAHVIANAGKIAIVLHDQTQVGAAVLKVIDEQDLAFLKITPPYPLARIEIADSRSLRLGDEVITVGSSPFLKNTISAGRITGVGQSLQHGPMGATEVLEVNINIYHGDSGGPLFNHQGQLIGLMVASRLKADRASYAIPSNTILQHYFLYLKELGEILSSAL